MMLQVRDLTKAFRGLVAVRDVSFDVAEREIVALIGPNGAGKTTCFNLIAGRAAADVWIGLPQRRKPDRTCARADCAARPRSHIPDRTADGRLDGLGERDDGRVRSHLQRG